MTALPEVMTMIPTETVPFELECPRSASELCGAALLRRFDALHPLQVFVLVTGDDPTPLLKRLAVVAAIELAMRSDAVPLHLLRRHLQDLLLAHSRYEEGLLYPAADQMLSPAERDDLIRRVQLFHGG